MIGSLFLVLPATSAADPAPSPPSSTDLGQGSYVRGNTVGGNTWGAEVGTVGGGQTAAHPSNLGNAIPEGTGADLAAFDSADQLSYEAGEWQWRIIDPPPAAGSPAWEGNDPATGSVISRACNGDEETLFMPGNNPLAPPPPPDPAVLAQQAYSELTIPDPEIGAGPDRSKLSVNLWTWLWIDDPGPQAVTVAAGGVSVTATATLSSVTWSLGEPASTGDGYASGPPVTVTCQGTGSAPPQGYDWKAEPPCGHMYHWRSLKERTGGTGNWPVTATSNWTVTWQSNTGVTGGTTLSATGNDAFDVGEYRTVLVQGP